MSSEQYMGYPQQNRVCHSTSKTTTISSIWCSHNTTHWNIYYTSSAICARKIYVIKLAHICHTFDGYMWRMYVPCINSPLWSMWPAVLYTYNDDDADGNNDDDNAKSQLHSLWANQLNSKISLVYYITDDNSFFRTNFKILDIIISFLTSQNLQTS